MLASVYTPLCTADAKNGLEIYRKVVGRHEQACKEEERIQASGVHDGSLK